MPSKTLILHQSSLSRALTTEFGWLGCETVMVQSPNLQLDPSVAQRVYTTDLNNIERTHTIVRGEKPESVVISADWHNSGFFDLAKALEQAGIRVFPHSKAIRLAASVPELGRTLDHISIPRYIGFQADSFESLVTAADVTGYPCLLSSHWGGDCLVQSRAELGHSWEQLYAKGTTLSVRVQPRLKVVSLLHSVVGTGLDKQYISDPVGFWADLPESMYKISEEHVATCRELAAKFLDYLAVEGLFTLTFAILENNKVVFYDFAPHPQTDRWVRIADTDEDSLSLYGQIISRTLPKNLPVGQNLEVESDSSQFIAL